MSSHIEEPKKVSNWMKINLLKYLSGMDWVGPIAILFFASKSKSRKEKYKRKEEDNSDGKIAKEVDRKNKRTENK